MNYGLTAAVVLGVLALSAPKEPQHNLMKLPSFKGILEVRASIPGRMRLFGAVPCGRHGAGFAGS